MAPAPRWALWLFASASMAAIVGGWAMAPNPWWVAAGAFGAGAIGLAGRRLAAMERDAVDLHLELQRQYAIREATHDMILVLNGDGRLVECNQQARRQLTQLLDCVIEPGDLVEPRLHDLFGDACIKLQAGVDMLGSGQLEETFETPIGRKSYRMTMLREGDGCVLVISDVSVQHQAWEAERDREREAERMENLESLHRLQRDFINTASHELQTPLTPLRLQTRILRARAASYLKEKDLHAIEIIERNTERMARLVEDVLEVVRLENGKLPITIEPMDLGHVVQATVTDHIGVALDKGVEIEFHGPAELMGRGDSFRVGQVVGNLLNNAIKFSDAGEVIRVGLSEQSGLATITVRDEGAGMDEEELQGLFQPFNQFHQDVRPGHGTGLGLAICHGIMEALGGDISAFSAGRGEGSVFTIQLPLSLDAPKDQRTSDKAQTTVMQP